MAHDILDCKEVLSLEKYSEQRHQTRKTMINQRKTRCISLTDNIRLAFENKDTVKYQIQEVIYAAKTAENIDVANEIATYKHLIPCGKSLKAALFLEFEKNAEQHLIRLKDIESTIYLQIDGHEKIWPVVNEDIGGKRILSPVHYLNFIFTEQMISSLKQGASMHCGSNHSQYSCLAKQVPHSTLLSLRSDFTSTQLH